MSFQKSKINPELDLFIERVIETPPELVWKAWTEPEHLKPWFCPLPWKTVDAEVDLRPGGIFKTVMQTPEGQQYPNMGCFLEVETNRKLTWTAALLPGFRPVPKPENGAGMLLTATIFMEPHGSGTKYTALAMHATVEDRKAHEAMGFAKGWGQCLDQLVAYMKNKN